jgi:mannose-6-phosphate isomerase-like protein (cupin superfamily)
VAEELPGSARGPVVIPLADLTAPPEQQTQAIERLEAFSTEDRWIGYVRTTPGEWSGRHHHGERDTYFFVIRGVLEFEYGPERKLAAVREGEFAYLPGGVIHRERTAPGVAGEAILIRLGQGPAVVNVDD